MGSASVDVRDLGRHHLLDDLDVIRAAPADVGVGIDLDRRLPLADGLAVDLRIGEGDRNVVVGELGIRLRVERYAVLAMLLSGALAGLGGATQVLGVHHRMFTDGSSMGFTGGAGFNGIVAALFGQLHPIGTIPASVLFGAMIVGANKMQRAIQIPSALVTGLNGLVVVFVVSSEIWRRRMARKHETFAAQTQEAQPSEPSPQAGSP